MRVQVPDYEDMVRRGMLEPLDRYIEKDLSEADLAAIPKQLLEAMRVDGHIYALPQDNAVYGLYYNKDLFDAAGMAYPDSSLTWEDLRAAARKLTKGNVHGLSLQMWSWPFLHFYAQAGGREWSEDGLTTLIAARTVDGGPGPGVKALEFLRALAYEDRSWEPYFGEDQGTGPDSRFANGSVAMYLDGSWMAANFENRNPRLRFAIALPARGQAAAVVAGSCLWAISAHARNKDEGWRMLRWLISPEQAVRYWDTLRVAPPANTEVINSGAFRSTRGIAKEGRPGEWEVPPMPESAFADRAAWILEAFKPDPATGLAPAFVPTGLYQRAFEDEVARMLRSYLEPRGPSAQEALDTAARNIHQVIDRDREARRLPPVKR
jgi:multiple sugar transport system substrate-binding protein